MGPGVTRIALPRRCCAGGAVPRLRSPTFRNRCRRPSGSWPPNSTARCSPTRRAHAVHVAVQDHARGHHGRSEGTVELRRHEDDRKLRVMSPYPGGLAMPELQGRPSCAQDWPAVLAPRIGDKAVGKWTIIVRKDGNRQWAYDGSALYTSIARPAAGRRARRAPLPIVATATTRQSAARSAPSRTCRRISRSATTSVGRMLETERGFSVYTSDADEAGTVALRRRPAREGWIPMAAPASVRAHGDWTSIERSPGNRQWVFRGKPLYRHDRGQGAGSLAGSDERGWHNVYVQRAPRHLRSSPSRTRPAASCSRTRTA